ncbi:hypothetical protein C8Q78DRAFT_1077601 [Trametes maxima]|nr:hypothetical protein C8Q78DRAFT_1077601 [Trametes maxima]
MTFLPALTPTTSPSETTSVSNADDATPSTTNSSSPVDTPSFTEVVATQAVAATQSSEITQGDVSSVWSTPFFGQTTTETSTTVIPMLSTITVSDGDDSSTTLTSNSSTPTSAAATAGEKDNSKRTGGATTAEIVAICIACLLFLMLCAVFCILRQRRRAASLDPFEDSEVAASSNIGNGDDVALGDYKNYSPFESSVRLNHTVSETNSTPNHLRNDDDDVRTDEQGNDGSHSTSQSMRSTSTLSYINSLCPEMAPLSTESPVTLPAPTLPTISMPVPRTQFRPLPMPFPLASLDRASVWSVMDANSTGETANSPDLAYGDVFALYHSSRNGSEVDIERPPEYSRY